MGEFSKRPPCCVSQREREREVVLGTDGFSTVYNTLRVCSRQHSQVSLSVQCSGDCLDTECASKKREEGF